MKRILHLKGNINVKCDNSLCDYTLYFENPKEDVYNIQILKTQLNKPCPKCGENLLTESDYKSSKTLLKFINFVNYLFGWLGKEEPTSNQKPIHLHVHNGFNIKLDEND